MASRVRGRPNGCSFLPRLLLFAPALTAIAAPLTLQISNEAAPPGGSAQIKVWASAPTLIASGALSIDFDPSIFGPVAQLAVFSATGDQVGYANVNGEHLDVHFSSPSAGIGQLPQLPLFTVSVPVLATAKPGVTSSIAANPSAPSKDFPLGGSWTDPLGNQYPVTVNPGTFTVGGSLSVQSVTPGGGLMAGGTMLQVSGTGFDSGTTVTIDGVSVSRVDFVSATRLNITLGGVTEMTGKHVRVTNSSGALIDYYSAPPSAPADAGSGFTTLSGVHTILPLSSVTGTSMNNPFGSFAGSGAYAMLNPNAAPATITFEGFIVTGYVMGGPVYQLVYADTLTIPPGQLDLIDSTGLLTAFGIQGTVWITSSLPIRFANIINPLNADIRIGTVLPFAGVPPRVQISLPASPNSVSWSWQVGSPAPAPASVTLNGSFAFTTSVSTTGGQWLSVTSKSNLTSSTLTLTPNPSNLSAGTYTGTVTITPIAPSSLSGAPVVPTTINVTLTATAMPQVSASLQGCCFFFSPGPGLTGGPPENMTVTSNGSPAQVTVSFSTNSGGDWLKVSPLSGTTPLQLTVTADPSALNLAPGSYTGQIKVQGPANTVTAQVGLNILAAPPHGTTLQINGPPPSFTLPAGSAQGTGGRLSFQEFDVALTSVQTNVSWLTASILSAGPAPPQAPATVELGVNSVGLSPGVYTGTITISSSNYPPLQVPVTLTVIAAPTAQTMLSVSPTSLSFSAAAGGTSPLQTLAIGFNMGPVEFSFKSGASWLQIAPVSGFNHAAPVYDVAAAAYGLLPGTYYSGLTIDWTTGSITVPITLTVTPTGASPPVMSAIVSAASATPSAIAPGEIISIFGTGIGGAPASPQLDASGKVATTLSQTQVLIGGVAAPLIYASGSQANVIVPFEVGTTGVAKVQVISGGFASETWDVPLAPAAPSVFTSNSTGLGQAAALNQDNSINSASNPAARGTVIQLYATGGGATRPAGVTGTLAPTGENLAQSAKVTIGGVDAAVQYAGSAPGEVEGLIQINAMIPQNIAPSSSAPVALTIGNVTSPITATIAVN